MISVRSRSLPTRLGWTRDVQSRQGRRVIALFAFLVSLVLGPPGWAATVQGVDISGDRIVLRFDAAVRGASTFALDAPQRITIDVDGASPGDPAAADGAVSRVRQGVHGADGARVVLDLARPVMVTGGQFEDGGRALALTVRRVDGDDFHRASLAAPRTFVGVDSETFREPPRGRYKLSIPVPAASKLKLPVVRGDDSRPLVVIDAGHGGVDPGAINPETGLREKDVTLRIAQAIRDALLATGKVRVALTREDDRYLVLRERFGIARRLHGDLFLSIHCDSAHVDATGASVYTLSEVASDKEAARLAARENKADIIAGVNLDEAGDVSSILIDLTQRETMNQSAAFARLLGREAPALMPTKTDFHRMASLMVLKAPDMPSALFETGYISNPRDAAFLSSRDGRERVAESVARAVEVFFARRAGQQMAAR
jgi:N-acetylmuramoyl-L-alanine amidase